MNTSELISIIIPTYKEAENIPVLSGRIDKTMKEAGIRYEIIIVDDDSNDGTTDAVEKIKDIYNIKCKVRKNARGLSSAVIEGFGLSSGEIICVMDADLQHPPESIPDLLKPITGEGYELVIGSRFVKGGSADFNIFRKINAWIPKMLARIFTKVSDPMAGFFAFPSKLLKQDVELNPVGFKICLELIVKASPAKIKDIPITFRDRLHGKSKLSFKEQINFIRHLMKLFDFKFKTPAEMIKFVIIGGIGTLVNLIFVYISKDLLSLHYRLAVIIGFVFGLTNNFLLNRKFTFKNARSGNVYRQYASFFATSLVGLFVNWLVSVNLYENIAFFNEYYLIASVIGIVCGFVINFIGSKFIVFSDRNPSDQNPKGKRRV